MDLKIKEEFLRLWRKYFKTAELPFTFYYSDNEEGAELVQPPKAHQCIIAPLAKVRKGDSLCFGSDSIGCGGGKRYLGYAQDIMPNFEYFLSCGIPGKLEGERYKKTPEIVNKMMENLPSFEAPGRFIIFKRWDKLETSDNPEVVIFFAQPDVLAGLYTLAGFEETDQNGVITPFGSGCSTIVSTPYLENNLDNPRAIIGMFDISARPFVPKEILSFAAPWKKFIRMIENMEESFLITQSWERVKKRIS